MFLLIGWTVLAIASLVDLQIGERLYLPAQAFDQSLRSALTAAAFRTGVPPQNPFFYPGHGIGMRYYYYWNVLCALPAKLFGLGPRVTTLAGVVWSGIALASLLPLYLKHFCEETIELGRKSLIGIALLAVTGLDLVPTIMLFAFQQTVLGDMEWWDGQQVTSWIDSLLWVPHHVAAVVACLIGFLVLWVVPRNASFGDRLKAVLIAALAFASAAGLSVYITFTFAVFLVIWTLLLLRSHLLPEALMFVAVGALAIVLSLAYLHELRQPGYTGSFALFYVRSLESIEDWAEKAIPWNWVHQLFLAALLPVYYIVELGFFALVGLGQALHYWRRPAPLLKWETAAVTMCGASFLVGSFLMSTTGNNDLGYRSLLIAQFILLLWAALFVHRWKAKESERTPKLRLLFRVFLWIGIFGTVYQLGELRVFSILVEKGQYVDSVSWLPRRDKLGPDLFQTRTAFEELMKTLPEDAVIQYSPLNLAYVPNIYYLRRQTVAGMPVCGSAFGGDPFLCLQYQNKLAEAFNGRKPFELQDANQLCEELGIDVLIAERSDRMWGVPKGWVRTGKPVLENDFVKAIACGRRRDQIAGFFAPHSEH